MKLTGRQIREVNLSLQRYSKQRRGPHFVNMIARNILKIKPIVTSLGEQEVNRSDEFKEYDEKRTELCKEMADTNAAGDPLMNFDARGVPMSYKIIERKDEFDIAVKKLKEGYTKAIDEETERKKEFEEFLDDEKSGDEINFMTLPFDAIPVIQDPKVTNKKDVELVVEPGDVAVFMEYGIIVDEDSDNVVKGRFSEDDEDEEEEELSSKPRKARNKRKR